MAGRRAGQACLALTHIVALLAVLFKAKTQVIMAPLILFVCCFSENGCCLAVYAGQRNDVILAEACRNDVEAYCKDVEPGGCVRVGGGRGRGRSLGANDGKAYCKGVEPGVCANQRKGQGHCKCRSICLRVVDLCLLLPWLRSVSACVPCFTSRALVACPVTSWRRALPLRGQCPLLPTLQQGQDQ